jgi:hypothetical protein
MFKIAQSGLVFKYVSLDYCEHIVLMISDEFWHETSCIGMIISLIFYAYVERQKRSPDAILMSVLV